MQVRETAQQISNCHGMLPRCVPSINGIDPLLRSPSPKSSFTFRHLAEKEKQNVLSVIRGDPRIVERVVEWPNQPVESDPKVHRAAISIEPVLLRIAREHVSFNSCQLGRAVVPLGVDRTCPRSIVGFLGSKFLRPPLGTRSSPEEV